MIGAADEGATVAAALRRQLRHDPDASSWAQVRRLCTTGKVFVDDERALDPARRLRAGQTVAINVAAPRPDQTPPGFRIVFDDAHLVVIDKPSGISSVPFDRKETGTAMDMIRGVWRRKGKRATATPLYIVHRIDKDTSGLLCFAKTRLAERALHAGLSTPHRPPLLPGGGGGRGRRDAHRVAPDRRSRRRDPRLDPPHRAGPARRHVRGAHAPACGRRRCAASDWRPGARTRSGFTSRNAATRWSAKRSTFATCVAPVENHFPPHG